jgi:hypothetical protein
VEAADSGHFVEELDNALHVSTKDALRKLVQDAQLARAARWSVFELWLFGTGRQSRLLPERPCPLSGRLHTRDTGFPAHVEGNIAHIVAIGNTVPLGTAKE